MSPAIGVARQAGARMSLSRALSWAQPNDDESDHDDRHDQRHDSHNREQDNRRRVHRGRDGYRVCVIRCQAGAGCRSGVRSHLARYVPRQALNRQLLACSLSRRTSGVAPGVAYREVKAGPESCAIRGLLFTFLVIFPRRLTLYVSQHTDGGLVLIQVTRWIRHCRATGG
jgi:hypothetical protein